MAQAVAKAAFKHVGKGKAEGVVRGKDPYYDQVQTKSWMGMKRTKKVWKQLPPYLTEAEAKALKKFKKSAHRLDMGLINKGPITIGWSGIIGLVPAAGDAIDVLLALKLIRSAQRTLEQGGTDLKEFDHWVWKKMYVNVVWDGAIGLVPIAGDVADLFFRCNTRNAIRLENALRDLAAERRKKSGHSLQEVDMSLPENHDEQIYEEMEQVSRSSEPRRRGDRRDDRRMIGDEEERSDYGTRNGRTRSERVPDRDYGSRRGENGHAPSRQGSRLQRKERRQY